MNWKEYLQSNNPVAAALLSKMGYNENEKIQVKKEFLRMMVKMELDSARIRFVTDFFEKYLMLNQSEEEELMKEINQLDNAEEIRTLTNSWEERGKKKGREEGVEEGIEKVAIELIKEGSSTDLITKVTHLDKNEIDRLRNELDEK